MIRKWHSFFNSVAGVMVRKMRGFGRVFLLGLLTLLLTLGFSTVTVSQVSPLREGVMEVNTLEETLEEYHQQGDILNQAATLSNLSLVHQQQGNWQAAKDSIQQSLGLLEDYPATVAREGVYAETSNILGRLYFAQGEFADALTAWEETVKVYTHLDEPRGVKRGLINQAKAMQELGLFDSACDVLLESMNDHTSDCQRFIESQKNTEALEIFSVSPTQVNILGLRRLGNVLRSIGELDLAEGILEQSQQMAQGLGDTEQESITLLSLGNVQRARGDRAKGQKDAAGSLRFSVTFCPQLPETGYQDAKSYYNAAIKYYNQAAQFPNSTVTLPAQIHQLSLLLRLNELGAIPALVQDIEQEIKAGKIKSDRTIDYALVNYAQSLACWQQSLNQQSVKSTETQAKWQSMKDLLNIAIQHSESREDDQALAYSLGYLGKIYEQEYQVSKNNLELLNQSKEYTKKALNTAQSRQQNSDRIGYQWQWQLGRILKSQKAAGVNTSSEEIINAYRATFNTLQVLRNDLLAFNQEIQYNFRDQVEPIYRELADLLLTPENNQPISQDHLKQAREVIESLQLAEIENFLQDSCSKTNQVSIEKFDPNAAILYYIILEDRLEIIGKVPNQDKLIHSKITSSDLSDDLTILGIENSTSFTISNQLEETIEKTLRILTVSRSKISETQEYTNLLYQLLIKKIESDIKIEEQWKESQIKTLVFVLDSSLRNIPMSVLYDANREQYLVERYAIAVTPGLQLLDTRIEYTRNLRTLATGANEAPSFLEEDFYELNYVYNELESISKVITGHKELTEKLEEQQFTKTNIQTYINSNPFSIVHIATHGRFSSNPENTFILDWNGRITINDLGNLFQVRKESDFSPVQMLILSACQTASGDKRAALGLAGVAIRSGVRSTLASLWTVNDASTALLMEKFYQKLVDSPTISKAEALRDVQIEFLKHKVKPSQDYNKPYYWGAFTLVGNWL